MSLSFTLVYFIIFYFGFNKHKNLVMSDNSPKARKPIQRRLTIARDDPFLMVFMDKAKKDL
jgi:hypothetical protein